MCLEAGVAAAARDVRIGVAVSLDAEEGVLINGGHLAWVLQKSCRLGKVLMR